MKQKNISTYSARTFIAVAFLVSIFQSSLAYAGSSNITPPFDIGSSWNICQGYNNPIGTHTGISSLSLDITGGAGCDSSAAGRTVRAPFAGKVYWYTPASGSLCINSNDNRSVMLTHIDSSIPLGTTISVGQEVGTIAAPYKRANNGVAHLHLQAWSSRGCPQEGSSQIPFDSASGMRMCGAPDMTINGPNPYNNGTWSGTSFTAQSCTYIEQRPAGYVYRFWSPQKSHHFYTADYSEAQYVADTWPDVWEYEPSQTFQVAPISTDGSCPTGTFAVYRFWSAKFEGHFYTIDPAEKQRVISSWPDVWNYEKVAFCASPTQTADYPTAVYRFWSESFHSHFYTNDPAERDRVISTWPTIWSYEGIAYYVKN